MADKKTDGVKKKYDPRVNLRPVNTLSKEEAHEVCSKGGKAVQEMYRRRKSITEILGCLLAQPASNEMLASQTAAEAKKRGLELSKYDAVAIAQVVKAAQGDTRAAEWVRDSAGDKPTDKTQISADVLTDADREMLQRLADRCGLKK